MLIRDIAEVCVTLNRLEQDRRRSEEAKLMEAGILCEALKDEFGAHRSAIGTQYSIAFMQAHGRRFVFYIFGI